MPARLQLHHAKPGIVIIGPAARAGDLVRQLRIVDREQERIPRHAVVASVNHLDAVFAVPRHVNGPNGMIAFVMPHAEVAELGFEGDLVAVNLGFRRFQMNRSIGRGRDQLRRIARHDLRWLAESLQVSDQVGHRRRRNLFLDPVGHERFAGVGEFLQLGAQQFLLFALGADERDAGGGFRLQHAGVLQAALGAGDEIEIAPIDGPVRIENGDEQRLGGAIGHGREVRPDGVPRVAKLVARGTGFLVDGATACCIAGLQRLAIRGDELLAVGIDGRVQHFCSASAKSRIGIRKQALCSYKPQLSWHHRFLVDGVE